jgi:AraC-like DNA-binding protein
MGTLADTRLHLSFVERLIGRTLPSIDSQGVPLGALVQTTGDRMTYYTLAALNRLEHQPERTAAILQGGLRTVLSKAQTALEDGRQTETYGDETEHALLVGDCALAQGLGEEAEAAYRRAVKTAARGEPGQVRVVSCSTTGMLALFRRRFGTAMSCFRRMAEDNAASELQRLEAQCGQALVDYSVGLSARAMQSMELASQRAQSSGLETGRMMVDLLRAEMLARMELLSSEALRDHVFWQQTPERFEGPAAAERIQECLASYGMHPLMRERLNHLRAMLQAAGGDAGALTALRQSIQWLRQVGMSECERQSRYEAALAAVTLGDATAARSMLEPLICEGAYGRPLRSDVELQYCLSKIHQLAGHIDQSLKHYQRYAMESVQCLRGGVCDPLRPHAGAAPAAATGAKDDVEMRLPAKYRHAYRHLLDNLASPTLGVRELSESIGVTDRTLQLVFKTYLGMTPVQVIQRGRAERIRDELINGDHPSLTVMEAAQRWGIRNRSTLVAVYRRFCHETPAQTLLTRGSSAEA